LVSGRRAIGCPGAPEGAETEVDAVAERDVVRRAGG
jgi:hypothetical protein